MKGYEKKALIVWANYTNLCNSIVGQYFKGTCDVMLVTMATRKIHKKTLKISVFVNYLKNYVGDHHVYLFVGKLPKFFNFSDSMTKSYLADFKIQRKKAFYGLQKIVLDSFPRNFSKCKCFLQVSFLVRAILRRIGNL